MVDLADTNGDGVSSDGSRRANGSDVWCLRWTFLDGFICLLTVVNELIPSHSCSRRARLGGFAAQEIRGVTNTTVTHVSGAPCACGQTLGCVMPPSHIILGVLALAVFMNTAPVFVG